MALREITEWPCMCQEPSCRRVHIDAADLRALLRVAKAAETLHAGLADCRYNPCDGCMDRTKALDAALKPLRKP